MAKKSATPEAFQGQKFQTVTISGLAASIASIAPNQAQRCSRFGTGRARVCCRRSNIPIPERANIENTIPQAPMKPRSCTCSRTLGLPISGSRILPDALGRVRREVAKRNAGKGKKNPHLIIAGGPPKGMTAVRIYGQGEIRDADAVVTIDIDLEKLFAQIEPIR